MRKTTAQMFQTKFWRKAYEAMPAYSKQRYAEDLLAAERWELGLDRAIEAWTRLKTLFAARPVGSH